MSPNYSKSDQTSNFWLWVHGITYDTKPDFGPKPWRITSSLLKIVRLNPKKGKEYRYSDSIQEIARTLEFKGGVCNDLNPISIV